MDDHPVHTKPNPHPTKIDVLPKTFLQVILGAKYLVQHSSMSPQPAATTFAFPSVRFLFYGLRLKQWSSESCVKTNYPAKSWAIKYFKKILPGKDNYVN